MQVVTDPGKHYFLEMGRHSPILMDWREDEGWERTREFPQWQNGTTWVVHRGNHGIKAESFNFKLQVFKPAGRQWDDWVEKKRCVMWQRGQNSKSEVLGLQQGQEPEQELQGCAQGRRKADFPTQARQAAGSGRGKRGPSHSKNTCCTCSVLTFLLPLSVPHQEVPWGWGPWLVHLNPNLLTLELVHRVFHPFLYNTS